MEVPPKGYRLLKDNPGRLRCKRCGRINYPPKYSNHRPGCPTRIKLGW